jgi:ketosteroid isomerase-like protein
MQSTATDARDQTIDDAFFARYQQAWSESDIDAIVEMMTSDGLYEASFGPEPWGQRFVGHDEIRAGLTQIFSGAAQKATHEYDERYAFGNHGFSTWTSTSIGPDGQPVAVHGCDFCEFRDGLVAKKIAFRKAKA